jgi:hypothetical protein
MTISDTKPGSTLPSADVSTLQSSRNARTPNSHDFNVRIVVAQLFFQLLARNGAPFSGNCVSFDKARIIR